MDNKNNISNTHIEPAVWSRANNYNDETYWMPICDRIAEQIIHDFSPKTVLDAGCSTGDLVEALRSRGVSAFGIDSSELAIAKANATVHDFCIVHSIAEPLPADLPQKFDLIIIMDVMEHIYPEQAIPALALMCQYTDTIIFASTAADDQDYSHYNVQKPEYWARLFAINGFYHDLVQRADNINPLAMIFRRGNQYVDIIQNYEKHIRISRLEHENIAQQFLELSNFKQQMQDQYQRESDENEQLSEKLILVEDQLTEQSYSLMQEQQKNLELEQRYQRAINDFIETRKSTSWRVTAPLRLVSDIYRKIFLSNRLAHAFRKFRTSLRRDGLRVTMRKVKSRMSGKQPAGPAGQYAATNSGSGDPSLAQVQIDQRFRQLQPIPSVYIESEQPRLNLVTDSIEAHSLLGGVATALIIATEFVNKHKMPLRIITRTTAVNPINYYQIMSLSQIRPADQVAFYSDFDRDMYGNKNFRLDVSKNDIFMATSWWSAAAITKTTIRKRFFYVLQEVETYFYPHGDDHLLCTQIMNDKNIDFIINSHYLFTYFAEHHSNIAENGQYFEPAFPMSLYQPKPFRAKKRYKLFFYARPNNPRNLFHFGMSIIERCISAGIINTREWDIYCVGQDIPTIKFSNGASSINLGQLSWSEYAKFLGDVDLALSLMYTPHPSYPPFDVASSGGVVVTNICQNKTEMVESKNILLGDLDEEQFLKTMTSGIALAKDMKQREQNYRESRIYRSWQENLAPIVITMGDIIKHV